MLPLARAANPWESLLLRLAGVESDIAADSGDSTPLQPLTMNPARLLILPPAADSAIAQSLSITGADAVAQFSTMQLTATTSPSNAEGTYIWSSNNDNILTVDQSGTVTGVRQGTRNSHAQLYEPRRCHHAYRDARRDGHFPHGCNR